MTAIDPSPYNQESAAPYYQGGTIVLVVVGLYLAITVAVHIAIIWVFVKSELESPGKPIPDRVCDLSFGIFMLGPRTAWQWPIFVIALLYLALYDLWYKFKHKARK